MLYGQQARPYALIAMLASINLLAFLRFLDAPEPRRGGLTWAITSALLLYAQYMGVLFIGVCALYGLIVSPRKRLPILGFGALACAAIAAWALPAMWSSLSSMKDPVPQVNWIEAPTLQLFVSFFVSIFGESALLRGRWLVLGLAALAVVYLVSVLRTRRVNPEHLLLIALGIAIPTGVFLLSALGDKPVFVETAVVGVGDRLRHRRRPEQRHAAACLVPRRAGCAGGLVGREPARRLSAAKQGAMVPGVGLRRGQIRCTSRVDRRMVGGIPV